MLAWSLRMLCAALDLMLTLCKQASLPSEVVHPHTFHSMPPDTAGGLLGAGTCAAAGCCTPWCVPEVCTHAAELTPGGREYVADLDAPARAWLSERIHAMCDEREAGAARGRHADSCLLRRVAAFQVPPPTLAGRPGVHDCKVPLGLPQQEADVQCMCSVRGRLKRGRGSSRHAACEDRYVLLWRPVLS